MTQLDKVRLAYLRSQLADARSERNRLICEVNSSLTIPARKSRARVRYAAANADLQEIAAELEKVIAATKRGMEMKKISKTL
jgi:hypothetical protein